VEKRAVTTPSPSSSTTRSLAFVGSFTTAQRKARGMGIDVYRVDPESGTWQPTDHVPDLVNPSFLITDPARNVLYFVHGDSDHATALSIDASSGTLRLLGKAATGGMNGVHQALDPSRRFLIVANYASGSLSVLPVRPDGSLADFTQVLDLPGQTGPHRTEQTCAHPHHTVFAPSGCFLLVPDKGLDRVFVVTFDSERGRLSITACDRERGHAILYFILGCPSPSWSTNSTQRSSHAAGMTKMACLTHCMLCQHCPLTFLVSAPQLQS
jgi:6-phosphogluconolactonase (cycloisomerase 2 family)